MTHTHAFYRLSKASFPRALAHALVFVFALSLSARGAVDAGKKSFDIAAGEAISAIKQFKSQSGEPLLYSMDTIKGVQSRAVKGVFTPKQALETMFSGTELSVMQDGANGGLSLVRSPIPNGERVAPLATTRALAAEGDDSRVLKLDAFEVMDSKLLNMDKPRTMSDPQPYVVFDRTRIEQSGAVSIEDFLKQRLPSNASAQDNATVAPLHGNRTQIDLRGLGANQTLILLDGHRLGSDYVGGIVFQPDLNGIPLSAVERIEVLATTASGIYGGSATGGVINVILRRDYVGAETKLTYENTFDTDAAIKRFDISAGLTLEKGKTNILLAASFQDGNTLTMQDRDLLAAGNARILANNPAFFLNSATPPLGATSNIRSSTGVNLVLKPAYGSTALNSPITYIPLGYSGVVAAGGAPLVANAGKYNFDLANTAQSGGTSGRGGRSYLTSVPRVESVTASVRRQFSSLVQGFIDLGASNTTSVYPKNLIAGTYVIPTGASNNPFLQDIRVRTPAFGLDTEATTTSYVRRAIAGAIVKLPFRWIAEGDYSWQRNRTFFISPVNSTTGGDTTAIVAGTIDILRDTNAFPINLSAFARPPNYSTPIRSTLKTAALRGSGPIWDLPAGTATLSALLERRDQEMSEYTNFNSTTPTLYFARSQRVDSAYIEALAPIVSAKNELPGVRSLDLQIAARHDKYTVNGATAATNLLAPTAATRATSRLDSTNPTFALKYSPIPSLAARASYGTGFLPPDVTQLIGQATALPAAFFTDPRRGNTPTGAAAATVGGNPNLKPEYSKSRAFGIILTPTSWPDFRFSVDWSRIEKRDNIAGLQADQSTINNEASLPGRIIRGPVPAGDIYSVGPIIAIDFSSLNIARAELEAYDFTANYTKKTASRGTFDVFILATRQTHFKTQLLPSLPFVETVGISSLTATPLKWKGAAGLTWRNRQWTLGWNGRYCDSYVVSQLAAGATAVLNQGNGGKVDSQFYHDISAAYRFSAGSNDGGFRRWLTNSEVKVGIKNVFDQEPPLDVANSTLNYSALGDPRLASYYVSVKKTF